MKIGDQFKIYNPSGLQKVIASQEAQAYAMAFLSFFALAFFTIFAIRPTLTSFFNLRRQIQDARDINVELDEKINQLLQAQQIHQAYQSEIALLDKALPNNPELAQLIQKLETIINEKNATATAFSADQVTLLDISPVTKSISDSSSEIVLSEFPVESVSFTLAINSDYRSNESVLQTLLNLKRLVSLSTLQFTADEGSENNNNLTIDTTLTADAHYLPNENNK